VGHAGGFLAGSLHDWLDRIDGVFGIKGGEYCIGGNNILWGWVDGNNRRYLLSSMAGGLVIVDQGGTRCDLMPIHNLTFTLNCFILLL